jgi:hypothetical protein
MAYRAIDGSTILVNQDFRDDEGNLYVPAAGYPKVAILDQDKDVITSTVASPTVNQSWEATLSLPALGIEQSENFRVRWRLRSTEDDKIQVYEELIVLPAVETRDSDIVVLTGKKTAKFTIPLRLNDPADDATFQIYVCNEQLYQNAVPLTDPAFTINRYADKTVVKFPVDVTLNPAFDSNLIVVETETPEVKEFTYRLWVITPQMIKAMNMLEDFLNKARVQNVIPQLAYTSGDLISYLERGLYLFNMTGQVTAFTGTNMQGSLLDAWLICSTYWALGSQLIAEGSLSFDFSGQSISLNVDRTPQLDSALGRIEARIQDQVLPLKKQMVQNGILAGDGSIGKTSMRNPQSISTVGLTNTTTTRIHGFGAFPGLYINRLRG